MSGFLDDTRFLITAALLLLALSGLLVTYVKLARSRRKLAKLRRELAADRRAPRPLTTAGRAVRAVAETAFRVREKGVSAFLLSSIEDAARLAVEDRSEIVRIADADGRVTIFFSDIESSTALNEQLGDKGWVSLLAKHDSVVRANVDKRGGHIVKSQGDGFMIVFRDPESAVLAGIAIQKAFAAARGRRLGRTPIRVRIGVHVGSAIEKGGDYFGRNVAMAARVAAEADGGEILVSDNVRATLAEDSEISLLEVAGVELKGFDGAHTLWSVDLS